METYTYQMKTGIVRTKEFERKGLAIHGVNVGLKCGHECTYFSTPTMIRACPLLPGIADSPEQIDELVKITVDFGAEEIFGETVNPRGRGLILIQQALENASYHNEAKAIEAIRTQINWSGYTAKSIRNLQQSVRKHSDINKLRFLLYPKGLTTKDISEIEKDDTGVVWL